MDTSLPSYFRLCSQCGKAVENPKLELFVVCGDPLCSYKAAAQIRQIQERLRVEAFIKKITTP